MKTMPEVLESERVFRDQLRDLWFNTSAGDVLISSLSEPYADKTICRDFSNEQIRLWLEKYNSRESHWDADWRTLCDWLSYNWTT